MASAHAALSAANLGERGQNRRLRASIATLFVALGLSAFLVRSEASPLQRLVVFVPFFLTAYFAFQGLYRTCPLHSQQGTREGAGGASLPVADERVLSRSRRVASRLTVLALAMAAGATAVVCALPTGERGAVSAHDPCLRSAEAAPQV